MLPILLISLPLSVIFSLRNTFNRDLLTAFFSIFISPLFTILNLHQFYSRALNFRFHIFLHFPHSIDGGLWSEMRKDFSLLLKSLGGADKLKKIAKKHLDALSVESTGGTDTIDANSIALLTMKVFVEFLFDREWETKFEILVLSR
jgi:hypothetical protein